jgi:hypothetical protein
MPSAPRWPPEPYGKGRGSGDPFCTLAPPAKVRGGHGLPPMPEPLQAAKTTVDARREERGKGGADEPHRHLHEPSHGLCQQRPLATTRREGVGRVAAAARVMGVARVTPGERCRGLSYVDSCGRDAASHLSSTITLIQTSI